jgi:hypothetical protein
LATGKRSYRLGVSTIRKIVSETCRAIWDALQPIVLPRPTRQKWIEIADCFENRWNFPNCIGAIDGKHIKIQCPPNASSSYYNHKGYNSIVLHKIVTKKYTWFLSSIRNKSQESIYNICYLPVACNSSAIFSHILSDTFFL